MALVGLGPLDSHDLPVMRQKSLLHAVAAEKVVTGTFLREETWLKAKPVASFLLNRCEVMWKNSRSKNKIEETSETLIMRP